MIPSVDDTRHFAPDSFGFLRPGLAVFLSFNRHLMDSLIQDLRFATRSWLKTPGLTFLAVLLLATGIGSSTAIYSLGEGVVLYPQSLIPKRI
jgi:hypothetical protein